MGIVRVLPTLLALILALSTVPGAMAQASSTIAGRVTTAEGAPAAVAQIVITNTVSGAQTGAVTSEDGQYSIELQPGTYNVQTSLIGYAPQFREQVRVEAGESLAIDFALVLEAVSLAGLEVTASRAVERQTPVAYSEIPKVQIQNQLGSRDLPLVLNTAPSVYSTVEGGGSGDARINVRGFDQRNTAVMINGVPVNDMENGWVYWSNWDGVGDAARSVQLQRGLSAVNLATPSVGGTLNIITDPTAQEPGIGVKQEFGSGEFYKTTVSASTGPIGRFAFTGNVVRKIGEGTADGLYTDSWAYYAAAAFEIDGNNRLELYAVGAPQRHGQRLYALNAGTWDRDFALDLDGYDPAALDRFSNAVGLEWSPNYGVVNPSYTGQQYLSVGPGAGTFARRDDGALHERENYFHKPQVNLNWYSYLGNGTTLSTIGYYSGGSGGGSGTLGSLEWDYTYTQRFPDWNATIAQNQDNVASAGILRNSVNDQTTFGAIAKLRKDFDAGLTTEVGIDWRTATIEHYRGVRDLLGGQYWVDDRNEFAGERQTGFGDKIDYHNENQVDWIGAHAQAESSGTWGSVYGLGGVSAISYDFEDFFRRAASDNPADPAYDETLKLSSGTLTGYQVKGGAMANVTEEWSVFGNAGWISKVPLFDGVINDAGAAINPDPKNETFLSFEAGVQYRSANRRWSADANVYHTTWRDRTNNVFVSNIDDQGGDGLINLLGVDARHMGFEASAAFQPNDMIRLDLAGSIGDWKHIDDAHGTYRPDEGSTEVEEYDFYIEGLKVGDAPQAQLSYAVSFFPIEGLYFQGVGKTFARHYAEFNPFDRTSPDDGGLQSWQAPGYTVFDLHGSFRINELLPAWRGGDVRVFANVYNLLDEMYVQDATDNSSFNGWYACEENFAPCAADRGHHAAAAEIFVGDPRRVNLGLEVIF
ncbi:MAG: TonB-dependent receptor plug domain-containing protein [Gemmatimonas sp.]|nr:TonB-dependent receptor plug domain-containing protein [Gemmatimonas sp.]